MSLADALERAASALPAAADAIRPANGDAERVLEALTPDLAGRVLTWLLGEDAEAGAEIASAWSECEGAAEVFAAVDESGLSRDARKVLRRARHRLRSRGVAVPAVEPEARVARLPGAGQEEDVEVALLSPYDPSGARVATLVEANPSGGARIVQVVTDARKGILDCRVYGTSRGKARRFVRELTSRDRFAGREAPFEAVRAWLGRCVARQDPSRPLPRSFAEWRSQLVGEGASPGDRVREALGEGGSARRAVEMIRAGDVGPWLPDGTPLRETAEKLQELEKSKIVVSGPQRRTQVEEILDQALDAIFAEDEAALVAEWLEETAWLLWQEERDDDARACLAGAGDREVWRAILDVALAPVLARLKDEEQEQEASSLVVKP